jgi:hypothetical protein
MTASESAREVAERIVLNCDHEAGAGGACLDCIASEIERQVAAAVAAERERCEKLVRRVGNDSLSTSYRFAEGSMERRNFQHQEVGCNLACEELRRSRQSAASGSGKGGESK